MHPEIMGYLPLEKRTDTFAQTQNNDINQSTRCYWQGRTGRSKP